uniref:Helicase ATP-binding domain-containing protein n=1 Tax=Magallana gigas TaxID=29159 RepID=A0A8W8JAS0_MAGGI
MDAAESSFNFEELKDFQKAAIEHLMKGNDVFLSRAWIFGYYIGKDGKESDSIKRGEYDFLFSSPEAVVGNPEWRAMLLGPAGERVRLLVIDEAHTVLHWGESDDYDEPFRQWNGKLCELRSLIECPILLLTATANSSARKKLLQKFCMKNCHEIIDNPERENINFS